MNLKPEEISKVIRSQIKYYSNALEQSEIGTVLTVGDGIVRASGLSNCMAGELLQFDNGEYAISASRPLEMKPEKYPSDASALPWPVRYWAR